MSQANPQDEHLDYRATVARLEELVGRELLVELRIGDPGGPFRVAARGVLEGHADGQAELSARRGPGDDVASFMLASGGFFTVYEKPFREGRWWAGHDDGRDHPDQPHLKILFDDSVLHVAVYGPSPGPAA
ncbi:hypothetical protein [Miltoncostaea marina]|uniref:hypothetical protein n=1 Tax=Miltoncostaea marina TaxID=2843215 RepID=UPI001C3E1EE0|nr:hypothetical protein [Miltoncostaea marina]